MRKHLTTAFLSFCCLFSSAETQSTNKGASTWEIRSRCLSEVFPPFFETAPVSDGRRSITVRSFHNIHEIDIQIDIIDFETPNTETMLSLSCRASFLKQIEERKRKGDSSAICHSLDIARITPAKADLLKLAAHANKLSAILISPLNEVRVIPHGAIYEVWVATGRRLEFYAFFTGPGWLDEPNYVPLSPLEAWIHLAFELSGLGAHLSTNCLDSATRPCTGSVDT